MSEVVSVAFYIGGVPFVESDENVVMIKSISDVFSCTVNGGWSSWGGWTMCTATCGGGTKSRPRSCTNPKPANDGSNCVGSPSGQLPCSTNGCPGMVRSLETNLHRQTKQMFQ